MARIRTVISATGSYIPPLRVPNEAFLDRDFRTADGERLPKTNEEIVAQFEAITGIKERRYAPDGLMTSDMAFEAACARHVVGSVGSVETTSIKNVYFTRIACSSGNASAKVVEEVTSGDWKNESPFEFNGSIRDSQ